MLYQPSYPSPYLSDVDGSKTNEFSCYINADGGTSVSKYKYRILTYNGELVHSETHKTSIPYYANEVLSFTVAGNETIIKNGYDYLWDITLYDDKANIWITYGVLQGLNNTSPNTILKLRQNQFVQVGMYIQIGNEKRLITNLNNNDNVLVATVSTPFTNVKLNDTYNIYSDNVTSSKYYFKARTTPVVSVDSIPSKITSKNYVFNATYYQSENVGYKYFEWNLYNENGGIIDSSGEKNSGKISYSFDGFLNNTTYGIGLIIENQDGVISNVPIQYFQVQYELPELENHPVASIDCNNSSVVVSWSPLAVNDGEVRVNGDVSLPYYEIIKDIPYVNGSSLKLQENVYIDWYVGTKNAPIYIPYESTTFINWSTDNPNFDGVIYKQEGEYIELIALSNVPPVPTKVGDKYYNTSNKMIYTANSKTTWENVGVVPRNDVIYLLKSQNLKYIYKDGNLIQTDLNLPMYQISYSAGAFYYDIINDNINIHDKVEIGTAKEEWILQEQNTITSDIYIWKDNIEWDDSLYWTETGIPYITQYWFKIALLPNKILVQKNEKL